MSIHTEILELVPLHALDALEGEERERVEMHVMTCSECRAELDRHRLTAGSLAADDASLPSDMWGRIEAALDSEMDAVVSTLAPRRSNRLGRIVLAAAAVLALVFAGVVIGQRVGTEASLTPDGIVAAADAAASDPQSVVTEFLVDGASVARVVVGEDGTGYVIPNEVLPDLSDDRTYQLWVITPDDLVISAGVLGNQLGPATFTWNDEIAGFALTREVAGGVVSSAGDVVSAITDL